jgi:hypothetical protein
MVLMLPFALLLLLFPAAVLNGRVGDKVMLALLLHGPDAAFNTAASAASASAVINRRVGDEVMLTLLLHGAVFAPLPGGNYLQLAGTSVQAVSMQVDICSMFTNQLQPKSTKEHQQIIYSEIHRYIINGRNQDA